MNDIEAKARELREQIHALILQHRSLEASVAADPNNELSRHEFLAIEVLGESGPSIMRSLAEKLHLAVNTVTTLVDNLERKHLVKRERDENDRRLVWVHLTREGERVAEFNLEERLRFCRSLLESLNEDEQEIYLVLMRKITREMNRYLTQAHG